MNDPLQNFLFLRVDLHFARPAAAKGLLRRCSQPLEALCDPSVPLLGAKLLDDGRQDRQHFDLVFGQGGARALAGELNVPLLGEIPLVQSIREAGDVGRPAVLQDSTVASAAFNDLCVALQKRLAEVTKPAAAPTPA